MFVFDCSALPTPPGPVKVTLEAVAMMMGESASGWPDLRRFVQRKDFISLVVNYDSASLTPAMREKVRVCE